MQLFDSELCVRCKGRGYCGKPCKILAKLRVQVRDINTSLKKEFRGSSPPTVFIGSKLIYPAVNVGIMSLPEKEEDAWLYDSPNYWSQEGINSKQIIKFRTSLINSRFQAKVFDIRKDNKLLRLIQEIGMTSLQSDVEIKLNKKPKPKADFDEHILPMGPSAQLKSLKLISNTKIPSFIEKVYFDTDLKSVAALKYLYEKGLDEHSLSQLLAIGITGLKKNRRLVSTRNSITAIDDTIGKYLLTKIRDYKVIEKDTLYFGGHLGNYYLILFFPDVFSYELFEVVFPKTTWNPYSSSNIQIMSDYENYKGRKNYAEETAGGYYAARYPILQHLENMKRQATILALRFVLPKYDVPLGVWVCRNSVKKALSSQPFHFDTKEEMLEYAKNLISNEFKFEINIILNQSKVLNEVKTQSKLNQYF
ncbi:MAG TPA: hypothetical protein VMZ91_12495 [Candidatus Paceibacterota bacterium]|nr:hypothetical protein [Candidatus Paceibacterota bacterium]